MRPAFLARCEPERRCVTGHTRERPDATFAVDAEDQTRQTFCEDDPDTRGRRASWSDVVEIVSYRVHLREQRDVPWKVAAQFLSAPYPAWSDVGVTELFEAEALIEMRCVAVVSSERER
jgi:enamine deaminase RidA (YjgF/YER057c/UK114 family)